MGFELVKDPIKNAKIRRSFLWDGAHDKGAQKELLEACKKDILFWINYFCFTFDPRKENSIVPFITYDYQDDAIRMIEAAIREGFDVAIEKSRDMGASWLNVIVPCHQLEFFTGKNFLLVSRNESYVDEQGNPKSLFWKIDFLLKHQPKWLKPHAITRKSMHIGNDELSSVISGESTTGEVGRGDRRTGILLDEFAAFGIKEGYSALSSTQSTTNCRIFNSTPKGTNNAFFDVVHKTGAKIIRMHWSQHPAKSKGLYCSVRNEETGKMELVLKDRWKGRVEVREKSTKASRMVAYPEDYPFILDGKLRSPWYDRECSRAVNPVEIAQELDIDYAGSDYQFFDALAVERYKERYCRKPIAVGDLELDNDGIKVIRFVNSGKGHFSLFEPFDEGGRFNAERRFVIGVDVSAGTGASNSTAVVYDRKSKAKVAEYANPNILPDDYGRFIVALARLFNDAKIVPDRSGPTGEVLVRRILSEGYSNIYLRRNAKKLGAPVTDEPGVWLNPTMRTTVLQNYRDAIGHCTIVNCSEAALNECLRFIVNQNGNVEHSAEGNSVDPNGARSNHGDLVIADALATLELMDNEYVDIPQERAVPQGTLAWRMEMWEREHEERGGTDELGAEWTP